MHLLTFAVMNLLSADNISKAFTEKWLFRNISFGIAKGDKLALVGANGSGKSTLLKVLTGMVTPDNGEVAVANGVAIGYLPQEPELDDKLTIEQSIFRDEDPVIQVVRAYESAINDENYPADKMQNLLEQMEQFNAWDFDKKVRQVLSRLGITDTKQLNANLSGGQKKRVALARLLILQPDVLVLDEPTNHLDLEAIEWLEDLLNAHGISMIMVTHDRYFLDNVSTAILELDRGKLYVHHGNYTFYLEKKSQRDMVLEAELAKARNLMVKELEWMRRMPKARGTKSKSRIEAFYELKDKAGQDLSRKELEMSVQSARLGNKIIEADRISMSYGPKKLINDFTYIFKKKDRIGVVGKNGIGKSTLLDVLTGKATPDSGEVVHGPTLKIGYYTQHTNNLDPANRIIEEVRQIADYVTLGNGEQVPVSKLLDMFLFPPAMQHTPVAKLSGGERRRLQLLKVLVSNPNFLVLDEPTNDLDIETLNVLEEFLSEFQGCLLLVSHDRYFMDRLVEHLFVFTEGGGIRDYYGNYTDYREEAPGDDKEKAPEKPLDSPVSVPDPPSRARKLSYKEQRELESLEKELPELEKKKRELEAQMNSGISDHEKLLALANEVQALERLIDEKSTRWLELSDN